MVEGLINSRTGSLTAEARIGAKYGAATLAQAQFLSQVKSVEYGLGLGTEQMAAMLGGMSAGGEIGGAKATLQIADALGFEGTEAQKAEQVRRWEQTGKIIDKKQADLLNKKFFNGKNVLQEGMRVDLGLTSDGRLRYLTAVSQDGLRSVVVKDGKKFETGQLRNATIGDYKFSGTYEEVTDIASGQTIARYDGIVNGREGHIIRGPDGSIVYATGRSGVEFHDYNIDAVDRVMSIKELQGLSKSLREQGLTKEADNIDRAIKYLREANLQAAHVKIMRDPKTGATATVDIIGGTGASIINFTLDQKGWHQIVKALTTVDIGRSTRIHQDDKTYYLGTSYVTGGELPYIFINNDYSYLHKTYGGNFWTDPMFGRNFTVRAASELGIFGKFEQAISDTMAIGQRLRITPGSVLGKVLAKAGVNIEAYERGERQAVEQVNANTLALGLQKIYDEIRRLPVSSDVKSKLFTEYLHGLYKDLEYLGKVSTVEQLVEGAPNPLKGQRPEKIREQPVVPKDIRNLR